MHERRGENLITVHEQQTLYMWCDHGPLHNNVALPVFGSRVCCDV